MEDKGDKEREREGLLQWGGGCGFPSCLEGGQTPGNCTRSEKTPRPLLSFLPSPGEPSVCNGFSSPETVVLFHQTLLNPQPGDSSSAAPGPAPPTRPVPPAPGLCPHQQHQQQQPPPRTHPDPASQLRRQRERAKYLRKRGGANPHGFAIGLGTGRQRGGKEGEGQRKKEVNRLRSGRLGALPPLPLASSLWLLAEVASRSPPPSLSLLLSPRSEHRS
uniref:Uncharacterized protein n=1 Tax=Myotis myotis TaxID=51298 RepID=A0A7J7UPK7_MYOMY|nr:hypothetical protein mMyoMyo1_008582 [Myotis myotis]